MDTPEHAASAAIGDVRGEDKQGSHIVNVQQAIAKAPGERLTAQLGGDTPAAMIDALHTKHFAGSRLGHDTEMWNLVMAFAADVKQLIEELGEAVEKL